MILGGVGEDRDGVGEGKGWERGRGGRGEM